MAYYDFRSRQEVEDRIRENLAVCTSGAEVEILEWQEVEGNKIIVLRKSVLKEKVRIVCYQFQILQRGALFSYETGLTSDMNTAVAQFDISYSLIRLWEEQLKTSGTPDETTEKIK